MFRGYQAYFTMSFVSIYNIFIVSSGLIDLFVSPAHTVGYLFDHCCFLSEMHIFQLGINVWTTYTMIKGEWNYTKMAVRLNTFNIN